MGLFQFLIFNKLLNRIQADGEERIHAGKVLSKKIPRQSGNFLKGMTAERIPHMIKMLDSKSRTMRENAYLTLRLYTGQDLGDDARAWQDWYEVNGERPSHEWWADAIGERGYNTYGLNLDGQVEACLRAVEDDDPLTRRSASRLLGHLTGVAVQYAPDGTEKMRRWQMDKWLKRWEKVKANRRK